MPMIASAAEQAASKVGGQLFGVAQLVKGVKDEKKAKQELSNLTPALYSIQPEYFQNKNLATEQAGQGLPSATKDYLTTEASRGLGAGIGALTQTGGGINDISKLMDVYNQSLSKIGAQDAETHLKNIEYFMGANKDLAGQKTMKWAINEYQPYQAKLKELTKRREAAEQNIWGGIQSYLGASSAAATGSSNQDLMAKLFGKNTDPYSYSGDAGGQPFEGLKQVPMPQTVNTGGTINTSLALPG